MRSSHNFAERRIALFDKSCMQKGYLPLAQYHPQDCLSRSPMPSVCHLVVHIYQFLALGIPFITVLIAFSRSSSFLPYLG